ncbi:MBL fold metallo-hydrolase [Amycolatopsis sp. cmx-11-51]|uniref:MBL fold metallo-hydrolase n=1 Tax=unclassified Amycolatopsis TaxID=2618356 RepID=UPI0039E330DD
MDLTHYGHACVLAELTGRDRPVRILFDPGTYSHGFDELRDLDLIVLTHTHPDHCDDSRVSALAAHNPRARLVHGADADDRFPDLACPRRRVAPGDTLDAEGVTVTVTGGAHAPIHPDLPGGGNLGYLLDDALFHPGDSFDRPPGNADIVLIPAGGPWMRLSEAVDYVRATRPAVAVPIHQAGLAPAHQQMHHQLLTKLAPPGTDVVLLDHATPRTLR